MLAFSPPSSRGYRISESRAQLEPTVVADELDEPLLRPLPVGQRLSQRLFTLLGEPDEASSSLSKPGLDVLIAFEGNQVAPERGRRGDELFRQTGQSDFALHPEHDQNYELSGAKTGRLQEGVVELGHDAARPPQMEATTGAQDLFQLELELELGLRFAALTRCASFAAHARRNVAPSFMNSNAIVYPLYIQLI